jgi:hypothetical protein
MPTGDSGPTRYRFGPLQRRGLIAGWRGGQIGAVAVGLAVAVGVLRAQPSVAGVVAALVAVCAGVGFATWPIGGRSAEEWTPDVARHVLGSGGWRHVVGSGGRRPVGAHPFRGIHLIHIDLLTERPATASTAEADRAQAGGLRRVTAGILHDRAKRTFTAVLSVSAPGFVLLGEEDKAARVAGWAGVLASVARDRSAVHRLQWLDRVAAGAHASARRHLRVEAVLPEGDVARDSYDALVDSELASSGWHDVLLAVTVHARHAARLIKAAGGGVPGACGLVLREVAALRRRLGDASIDVGPVLGPQELVEVVRDAYGSRLRPRPGSHASTDGSGWPWPMGVAAEWSRLRVDDTWHATYWIAEWPRTDVGPDFLAPLLLSSDVRRTVSVVMEPRAPIEAARKVEQARTADIADAELRRRGGFLATARRRREEEVLSDVEAELAEGHAPYRFSGYVTVSADGPDALDEACGRVEHAAGRAGLELRRCYGDQAHTFACTLPLGRGLS